MAVNFTGNIGLAKPTESELATNWATNTKLQEDNNIIMAAKMGYRLTAYTPTIVAATTAPTLGASGNIRGEYTELQGFVWGCIIVEFTGAGITVGSGEYGLSLPFPADGSFHIVGTTLADSTSLGGTQSIIGEGYISDVSAIATSGSVALDVVTVAGVSYVRLLPDIFTAPVKTSRFMRDNMPFAVADGDKFTCQFFYKKA